MALIDKIKYDKLKELGQILKEARIGKGLLLREVAAAIYVDTAMISKFEKGERKPTREQISLISKFLEIDEKDVLIIYLCDKIVSNLVNEDVAKEVLNAARKKIELIQTIDLGQ